MYMYMYVSGAAFAGIGLPEQAMGWLPISFNCNRYMYMCEPTKFSCNTVIRGKNENSE